MRPKTALFFFQIEIGNGTVYTIAAKDYKEALELVSELNDYTDNMVSKIVRGPRIESVGGSNG